MSDATMSAMGLAKRHAENPILAPQPQLWWCSQKVYNAAAIREEQQTLLIFRAIGDDWKSRLGIARSAGGQHFEVDPTPFSLQSAGVELHEMEDPRYVKIDGQSVMTFVDFDGECARQALAAGPDLHSLRNQGLVLPDWNRQKPRVQPDGRNWTKAGAMFSRQIGNRYAMLFGDEQIRLATNPSLQGSWIVNEQPVLGIRPGLFDAGYIEMGPAPIWTSEGWLVLYHGIQRLNDIPGDPRVYRLGAALLDHDDPQQVLWRCTRPILEPEGRERLGVLDINATQDGAKGLTEISQSEIDHKAELDALPTAIFCCGAILKDSTVWMYYSSGDEVINLATITLEDVLQH